MKKLTAMIILLTLVLAGCKQNQQPEVTMPVDMEPTASYNWMKGESPVENKRIGILRSGISSTQYAISPTGIYYLQKDLNSKQIIIEQLNANIYSNTSIDEIEKIAKEKLNMDYPNESQIEYITVND